jgi:hypothetical protein
MKFPKIVYRSILTLKKFSPEILVVGGITGVVVSTVMACKATLKADEIMEEAKEKIERINEAAEVYAEGFELCTEETKYTEKDRQKDLVITYIQTGVKFGELYGPAFILGAISVSAILGSYNIMRKRNLAVVAAYNFLKESFRDYRRRVIDDLGQEKDYQYRYGAEKLKIQGYDIDETGSKKKVKTVVDVVDPNKISQYAKFFDEYSPNWSKTPEYNLLFLKNQQNYANDLLHSRGHLFLNEVYDMLGLPHTQAGAVVGWIMEKGNDGFVDFGIYEASLVNNREFVNGHERSILLDFNVDGVIYDLI